jgi:hypothetical protein
VELKLRSAAACAKIIEGLRVIGVAVVEIEYQHDFQTNEVHLLLDLHLTDENALTTILAHFETIPNLLSLKIQRPIG